MPGIKELKTRIKSISGTRKVTRAMQMVSAAKMRKSQDATMGSRTYSSLAWELIMNLSGGLSGVIPSAAEGSLNDGDESNLRDSSSEALLGMTHLLKSYPNAPKIAILILTTNRGMVGSLNSNLLAMAQKVIAEFAPTTPPAARSPLPKEAGEAPDFAKASSGKPQLSATTAKPRSLSPLHRGSTTEGGEGVGDVDIITYGRKGRDVMVRSHKEVLADFEKFDRAITTEDIFPISELITKLYSSGKYQKVLIIYNHFVSTLIQKPTVKQLLPFAPTTPSAARPPLLKEGGETARVPATSAHGRSLSPLHRGSTTEGGEGVGVVQSDYIFEPSPTEVLNHLLPRIIESQIYQTILESEASEQSARMVMMKNATEAAGDLIADYTLTYNKLRQNKITTELAEITAGKIALE